MQEVYRSPEARSTLNTHPGEGHVAPPTYNPLQVLGFISCPWPVVTDPVQGTINWNYQFLSVCQPVWSKVCFCCESWCSSSMSLHRFADNSDSTARCIVFSLQVTTCANMYIFTAYFTLAGIVLCLSFGVTCNCYTVMYFCLTSWGGSCVLSYYCPMFVSWQPGRLLGLHWLPTLLRQWILVWLLWRWLLWRAAGRVKLYLMVAHKVGKEACWPCDNVWSCHHLSYSCRESEMADRIEPAHSIGSAVASCT